VRGRDRSSKRELREVWSFPDGNKNYRQLQEEISRQSLEWPEESPLPWNGSTPCQRKEKERSERGVDLGGEITSLSS